MSEALESGTQTEGSAPQWRALGFLAITELFGMTLWFSASAVVPDLRDE